ncbi:hypothetical protein lerEdw1_009476 [Lerista edwardsae]|nr:hypothetical protein lerEdw1_009476 [Lerista edwardsae]
MDFPLLGCSTGGQTTSENSWRWGLGGRTPSAVERLEADKVKYVKSQQVINSRQEPVLLSYARPPSPCCRRPLTLHRHNESLVGGTQDGPEAKKLPLPPQSPIARRGNGKRLLRPDSLVIYRQKRDCSAVNKENAKGYGLVRRLFQGPLRDGRSSSPPSKSLLGDGQLQETQEEASMACVPEEKEDVRTLSLVGLRAKSGPTGQPPENRQQPLDVGQTSSSPSPGPTDSKRELVLSYSLPLSEKERFFNYCGLDRHLVEVLGAEQFQPGSWDTGEPSCPLLGSLGSASSEGSSPSHRQQELSADEGKEKPPASISVVERNARVIKWLYGCQQAQTVAKESTV